MRTDFKPINQEDRNLRRKWTTKRRQAEINNVEFKLSYEDYKYLAEIAGIDSTQIGSFKLNYCLGRYNDTGPYEIGNCRFILCIENRFEHHINSRNQGKNLGGGNVGGNQCGRKQWKSRGYVHTPWGVFDSLRDAEKHPDAFIKSNAIAKRCRSPKYNDFYYEKN